MTANTFLVNVEAIVWRNGKLLTIVRAEAEEFGAGWLCFPGGCVDWIGDEADILEHTATREVQEEVGLHVPGPWYHVENHSFQLGPDAPCLDVVLLARSETGEPVNTAPDEVAELAWLTPEEILADARTQPWTKTSITHAQRVIARLGW